MIDDRVSVLIPTSPIPSHPSTAIIDETIASVRHHFPDSQILILRDGVREEQAGMKEAYAQYLFNLKTHPMHRNNIYRVNFPVHTHQVGMFRYALEREGIYTPYIMWVEQDTPLCIDRPIDWQSIFSTLQSGELEFVRFLPEESIQPEHNYLMCGDLESYGAKFVKTIQYSARPQIASVEWYKRAMSYFTPEAKCFLEDKLHSVCQSVPWDIFRMGIYAPEGGMKRSYHLDGRAHSRKYDETQVF